MSGITDKLFGNNIPNEVKRPTLTSFQTLGPEYGGELGLVGGGAVFGPQGNWLNYVRPQDVQTNLNRLSDVYGRSAGSIGDLMGQVRPGFGRLTQAANRLSEASIRALEDSRHRSLGTLRQNLQRRKIAGSSFAQDDINRTNREFDKTRAEIEARNEAITSENILKEMAMTSDLINQKAQAEANSVLRTLEQSNFETTLSSNIAAGAQNVYQSMAGIMAQMSNLGGNRLLNVLGTGIGGGLGLYNPFAASGGQQQFLPNPQTGPSTFSQINNPGQMVPGSNSFWTT